MKPKKLALYCLSLSERYVSPKARSDVAYGAAVPEWKAVVCHPRPVAVGKFQTVQKRSLKLCQPKFKFCRKYYCRDRAKL